MSLVPSAQFPDAVSALDHLLAETRSVRAAVAFVTCGGVDRLASLLDFHPHLESVSIVARGGPITEPEALLALRGRLGAEVAVIGGVDASRFHPKLWLLDGASGGLWALSGSGNLTSSGLSGNREQFELVHASDKATIAAQERRFDALTEGAIPLDRFEGSIAWKTWLEQLDRRAEIAKRLAEMDRAIAESPAEDRETDKQQLMDDLWALYRRNLEAKLKKKDGSTHNPSGLRLELEGNRGPKEPVLIASRICKNTTEGFDTLLEAGEPELTVEWLVADASKPYHTLFRPEIRRLAAERLQQFPGIASD